MTFTLLADDALDFPVVAQWRAERYDVAVLRYAFGQRRLQVHHRDPRFPHAVPTVVPPEF
jgi:hypothetical protein